MRMMKPIAAIKAITAAALLLLISSIAHAQTADKDAVEKVMRDYFEAYSRGDMAAVMQFINVAKSRLETKMGIGSQPTHIPVSALKGS
jgi:Na+/serine symporter